MAQCPFCNAEISEHLAVHGGTCPSCFGQVPGEEAPTDPGAAVRARQEKADAKTVQRSRIPLVAGVLALVGFVGGAAWFATRPPPEVPVLDFDLLEFEDYEIVAMPDADTEAPEVATAPRPTAPRPSGLEQLAQGEGPDIRVAPSNGDGVADAAGGGTRSGVRGDGTMEPDINIGGPSFGGGGSMDIQMDLSRDGMRGVVLTDDNDIIEMIRRVMEQGIPRLQSCYTRQLKVDESLRGDWVLEYTLLESGDASAITVEGTSMSNPDMESCIRGKVEAWNFQPIKADLPVRKTLRFRAR